MTQPLRLATGGRIDRTRPLTFSFDGKALQGAAGDTLASALLANNIHLVGRSFKYHRPRGIMTAGSEEPNALVTLDQGPGRVTPNLRATQIELYEGLTATSQNRWPSLRFDLGATAGLFAPLLSAGFPYKSFMWPPAFWHRLYEPAIRRAAGLGRAPTQPDPDQYAHQYAHCDILIIGGGPAGLAAAWGASATGARVILADEQAEPGGSLLHEPNVTIDGWAGPDWVRQVIATLGDRITLLARTTAFGWYPGNMIGLAQRLTDHPTPDTASQPAQRLWHVRANRVLLAAGAIQRPLLFPGNDRPGIMLAEAGRIYLNRYAVIPGRHIVITTADDSAYLAAADLHQAGVTIAAIADQRAAPDSPAVAAVRTLGIRVHTGTTIARTDGRGRVHTVRLSNNTDAIPCDTVLMSGGWTPSVHLHSQSRRRLVFDPASGSFLPNEGAVGACAGLFDLAACLREGTAAGGSQPKMFAVTGLPAQNPSAQPAAPPPHRNSFVDFQNDVTTKDLRIATQEGFVSIEHVKRYTTTGMATDQGKTSGLNALASIAALTGQTIDAVGLTTYRPPYTPVTFGALAGPYRGATYAPIRLTPIALANADTENIGLWQRPRAYRQSNETMEAAVTRECHAVRTAAGIFDASTLGKLEIAGPDAQTFLNRIYTGDFSTLAPGRCRYALLLTEDGCVKDDGIVARLATDRFHVTTTTANAGFVPHHMEDYRQTEFTKLRVWLTSITEQWAVIALQGPSSADILAPLLPNIDLTTLPHNSVRETHIGDIPIRLFRAGFTGESGFELNLPPPDAQRIWDTLQTLGVTPYGTDAMHRLRAQKGYIVIGQETDGTVTPDDLGLAWTISPAKPDFIGARSLRLSDLARPGRRQSGRKQLVGLRCRDPDTLLQEGAQITGPDDGVSLGHVTSAWPGAALALVESARSRHGQILLVRTPKARPGQGAACGGGIPVDLVDPVQYDKAGERPRPAAVTPTRAPDLPPAASVPSPPAMTSATLRIAALAPTTQLSIQAGTAAATAIGLALGLLLPSVPCRSVIARNRAALWLGPGEWLIQAADRPADLLLLAREAAGSHPACVVDVSHQTRALELAGPLAGWCLNGFCALDLDLGSFPTGMCTRTLLGKADIVLWRLAPEIFRVEVARSLLPYVWRCLRQAFDAAAGTPKSAAGTGG